MNQAGRAILVPMRSVDFSVRSGVGSSGILRRLAAGAIALIGLASVGLLGGCETVTTTGLEVTNKTGELVRVELLQVQGSGDTRVYSTMTLAPEGVFAQRPDAEQFKSGLRARFVLASDALPAPAAAPHSESLGSPLDGDDAPAPAPGSDADAPPARPSTARTATGTTSATERTNLAKPQVSVPSVNAVVLGVSKDRVRTYTLEFVSGRLVARELNPDARRRRMLK